jgi:hypothetical protein
VNQPRKIETSWQEHLDVVCCEPWTHLRIEKERFRYADSGLPKHATVLKGFLALAITFKTRCSSAAEGPGVGLLFGGRPQLRQRVQNMKTYENLLQWRLTLRFHEPKE